MTWAAHYVPDWAVRAPVPSATLKDAKVRADRQVAHVTSERKNLNFSAGNSFEWQVGPIVAELRTVLAAFLNSVPLGLLDPQRAWSPRLLATPLAPAPSIPAAGYSMVAKTCPPDNATVITTICPKPSVQATTE